MVCDDCKWGMRVEMVEGDVWRVCMRSSFVTVKRVKACSGFEAGGVEVEDVGVGDKRVFEGGKRFLRDKKGV